MVQVEQSVRCACLCVCLCHQTFDLHRAKKKVFVFFRHDDDDDPSQFLDEFDETSRECPHVNRSNAVPENENLHVKLSPMGHVSTTVPQTSVGACL